MKNFAVLDENNTVTNIIVASSLKVAEDVTKSICVEVKSSTGIANIGFKYNEEENKFQE